MNTDKIYAEQIANQYAEKETSKVKVIVVGSNSSLKHTIHHGWHLTHKISC